MSLADSLRSVLRAAGSLKLTLVILVALAIGIIVAYHSETRTTWTLVVPLTLAALNLMAAVATNAVFRRQSALLVFHLALIAILLLVAAGRLSYFKGQIEFNARGGIQRRTEFLRGGPVALVAAGPGALPE